jgi:hypothetical protein
MKDKRQKIMSESPTSLATGNGATKDLCQAELGPESYISHSGLHTRDSTIATQPDPTTTARQTKCNKMDPSIFGTQSILHTRTLVQVFSFFLFLSFFLLRQLEASPFFGSFSLLEIASRVGIGVRNGHCVDDQKGHRARQRIGEERES